MNKPQSGSLREIFLAAVEIEDPLARAAYLGGACGGDLSLRQRVEQLLAADEGGKGQEVRPLEPEPQEGKLVLERIGRYKLLQQIGEGGCGVVFMAEQAEPVRRRVALKVIKLGMDTRQVVTRFEAERQALAMMDHPNIARVLDAGATESGRPFFVMELVRGIKITDYCEQHQLSIRQRLDLFIQVCQAVQHAHQKGIIHRDLKPSNILVTQLDGAPLPKVIDFGIAKAVEGRLTDQTLFTAFEQFLGTPAYMSPEQAAMTASDIDTRSDIYSLGVLLYELLTGKTPFDTKALLASGLDEMRHTIREREPVRPSTRLSQELASTEARQQNLAAQAGHARRRLQEVRGDLDWIVMKCLEKDRRRRYETANALAMDLKRHLEHAPVLACPPSRLYECQKAVRRNKLGFAAATALILTLAAGVLMSWLQADRARQAEGIARRESYTSAMNAAGQALREGRLGRARELLRQQVPKRAEPDLRNWEWRHLAQQCQGDPHLPLVGHSHGISHVRFLDARRVLTTGLGDPWDQFTVVWDANNGQQLQILTNHCEGGGVGHLALSPMRKGIFSVASWEGAKEVRYLDLQSGRESAVACVSNLVQITSVSLSPDEKLLAVASLGWVSVYDIEAGTNRVSFPRPNNHCLVRFSPDGEMLASSDEFGCLTLWSVKRPQAPCIIPAHVPNTRRPRIEFSPNGHWLVSVGSDGATKVWSVHTGTLGAELRHQGTVVAAAFSPDSLCLAIAGSDPTIRLWETANWTLQRTLRGHTEAVQDLAFAPDGRRLASYSQGSEVKIWPLEQQPRPAGAWPEGSYWVGVGSDGSGFVRVPELKPGEKGEVWSASPLELRSRFSLRNARPTAGVVLPGKGFLTGVAIAAVGFGDGSIGLQTATGNAGPAVAGAHNGEVQALAVSMDGSILLSLGADGDSTTRVWRLPELEPLNRKRMEFRSAAVSDNGRIAALFSAHGEVAVCELPSLELRTTWKPYPPITAIIGAFSPDGRLLATACSDGTAHIWDLARKRSPALLRGLLSVPVWLAFSPDGTRLAFGTQDEGKLFDTSTGQEVASFQEHDLRFAFSRSGQDLVAVGTYGVRVFYAPPLDQIGYDWLQPAHPLR